MAEMLVNIPYMEPLGYIWTLEKNLAESDECWSVASPWFPVNTMVHAAPIAWFNYAILLAVVFFKYKHPPKLPNLRFGNGFWWA